MKVKQTGANILHATPLIVALVVVAACIYLRFKLNPGFVNFEDIKPDTGLSEVQKQVISMVSELNRYLISLGTLMFGAIGFFLTKYRQDIRVNRVGPAFLISLALLGLVHYYAFRVYTQLTAELSQKTLALQPGQSKILYYLEMEFWTSLGTSLILLFLFVYVFYAGKAR